MGGFILTIILLIPLVLMNGNFNLTGINLVYYAGLESFSLAFGTFIIVFLLSKINKNKYNYLSIIYRNSIINKKASFWVLITTISLLIVNIVVGLLYTLFNISVSENSIMDVATHNPIYLLYLIPIMLLIVGPGEEFIFRGVIQSTFRDKYGFKIGLIIASILFGLVHIPAVGGLQIQSMPYVFITIILALILGYVYEYQKNIYIPMIAHGIYNSLLLVFSYIQMVYL